MASEPASVSAVPAAAAGRTYPRGGRPRIAAIATDNFALFMLHHPYIYFRFRPMRRHYGARVFAAVANLPHCRLNVILLVDCRVAQLESDVFLSAHDSVANW